MTLILLAISLLTALCFLAFRFAIYALPFMVSLTAFRFVHATDTGFLLSTLAAIGAGLLSVGIVIFVLGFAKNPILRLLALAVFAVPAMVAGYALVHGVTHGAIHSALALNLVCGAGGFFAGLAAMANLNALGDRVLTA